jgi:hypothetical protein
MKFSLKKILRRSGFAVLILFAGILVLRAVLNFYFERQISAFQRLPEPAVLGLGSESGPDCPDDENAAPVWRAAAELLGRKPEPILTPSLEKIFNGEDIEPAARREIEELVNKNARIFDLLGEAAERPCFDVLDPNEKASPWAKTSGLNLTKILRIHRLLALKLWLEAETGSPAKAAGDCLIFLRGLRTFSTATDNVIYRLLLRAFVKHILLVLNENVSENEIPEPVLRGLLEVLAVEPFLPGFSRAISGERELLREGYRLAQRGALATTDPSLGRKVLAWLIRPLTKAEFLSVLKTERKFVESLALPYPEARLKQKEIVADWDTRPWYSAGIVELLPDPSDIFMKEMELRARLIVARTGIAVRLYHDLNNSFPSGLGALVPDFLPEIPMDPCAANPLIFVLKDDGFIVYSVGMNGKDQGGQGIWAQLSYDDTDDIAWKSPARRRSGGE